MPHSTYACTCLVLTRFFSFSCILHPICSMSFPDLESRVVIIITIQLKPIFVTQIFEWRTSQNSTSPPWFTKNYWFWNQNGSGLAPKSEAAPKSRVHGMKKGSCEFGGGILENFLVRKTREVSEIWKNSESERKHYWSHKALVICFLTMVGRPWTFKASQNFPKTLLG